MQFATAPLGAVAPLQFGLDLTPGESGVDLTTVTAAILYVRNPAGVVVEWAATLENQTSDTLTVVHPYASEDLAELGFLQLYCVLDVPGGGYPTTSVRLQVTDPFTG